MEREFVTVGKVVKSKGIRGELSVFPLTDFPQRFYTCPQDAAHKNIFLRKNGKLECVKIESVRMGKKGIFLKFEGVDTKEKARAYIGCTLEIERDQVYELPPDTYYIFDLIGIEVITEGGERVGEITDVYRLPANDVYVVHKDNQEILLPAVKEFIKKVDVKNRTMIIHTMDGLY